MDLCLGLAWWCVAFLIPARLAVSMGLRVHQLLWPWICDDQAGDLTVGFRRKRFRLMSPFIPVVSAAPVVAATKYTECLTSEIEVQQGRLEE